MVSHHPEYVALVYGAMRFLFIVGDFCLLLWILDSYLLTDSCYQGVVNYQKLLSQLCAGLSDIALILPLAKDIAKLHPTPQVKEVIMAIYTNILRFLSRALRWYQNSTTKHILQIFATPPTLEYDDLLATIKDLSRSMIHTALVSGQVEQRAMHMTVMQQSSEQKQISANLVSVMTEISEIKRHVVCDQALIATARMPLSQPLTEINIGQLLIQLNETYLPPPSNILQASLFLARRNQRRFDQSPHFWLDGRVQRWNQSRESSLVIIEGTRKTRPNLRCFTAKAIALLQATEISVIWALKTSLQAADYQTFTIDVLKYLISQAIRCNKSIHNNAAMAARLAAYREAESEEDYINILLSVLEGIRLVYIMIDLEVLCRNAQASARESWPRAFLSMFSELSRRSVGTILRVVFISCESPLRQNDLFGQYRDHVVHVDNMNGSRALTHRSRNSQPAHAASGNTASVNLEAIGQDRNARVRPGRASRRRRRD